MDSEHFDETEPLLDGIGELPGEALAHSLPPPGMREVVWQATAGRIRGRTRRRRALVACGLLFAYAAGLGSFWMATQRTPKVPFVIARQEEGDPVETRQSRATTEDAILTDGSHPTKVEPEAAPAAARTPTRLPRDPEAVSLLIARAPKEERPGLLIRVGDRYLNKQGDIKRATQCYRRALNLMADAGRTEVTSHGTWLFASLKQAESLKSTDSLEKKSTQEMSNENAHT